MPVNQVLLVDEYGHLLSERLHAVLATLAPRLQRKFPALSDDCVVTEILEEAGRRLAAREQRKGPIEELHSYAWTVACRMAALRLRHDDWVLANAISASDHSPTGFDRVSAAFGTAEQIEAKILFDELYEHLTPEERHLVMARHGGLYLDEIARLQGTSILSVVTVWRRVKRKLHGFATRTTQRSAHRA